MYNEFLQACFLCPEPLDRGDIYMYSDKPLGTIRCRKKQVHSNEAKDLEMKQLSSSSRRELRKYDNKNQSFPNKNVKME
ncbi:Protein of unknown function (DUF581) [Quillaja saponaria]|uniref:FLZ-type domain-containing protein n=1 Tax=Quillaja saponaria TaxID=32244 RepID=A0AAD7L4X6_QUISA|nr:Protein of unknown function (DUF581) [Quillaja saponaria]